MIVFVGFVFKVSIFCESKYGDSGIYNKKTIMEDDNLKMLISNTIIAFRSGYINADHALCAIEIAAGMGDKEAQDLLEKCRKDGIKSVLSDRTP